MVAQILRRPPRKLTIDTDYSERRKNRSNDGHRQQYQPDDPANRVPPPQLGAENVAIGIDTKCAGCVDDPADSSQYPRTLMIPRLLCKFLIS